MILHDRDVVNGMLNAFEEDWGTLVTPEDYGQQGTLTTSRAIKRTARTLIKGLPQERLVEQALKDAIRDIPETHFPRHKFEHHLEESVRQAAEDAVSRAVKETLEMEARA